MKKLLLKQRGDTPHWVGDGFPASLVFKYDELGKITTPFLLMDHAGPTEFSPSPNHRRGVGGHPHRGFETVTIVYEGQVEHRDSSGAGGVIQKGDVQWVTAGAGIIHEEFHGKEFSQTGGAFESIQLWVNLPAKDKMTSPRYQNLTNQNIPTVSLGGTSQVRVIAGEYFDGDKVTTGPALTYSPINLWDLTLEAEKEYRFKLPEGHTANLFMLNGTLDLPEGETLSRSELGVFQRSGQKLVIKTKEYSKILLMGGEPIDEPIIGWGPFVMNTQQEIAQALQDYQNGKMGSI